jgi:hypothetical protein
MHFTDSSTLLLFVGILVSDCNYPLIDPKSNSWFRIILIPQPRVGDEHFPLGIPICIPSLTIFPALRSIIQLGLLLLFSRGRVGG